MSDSPMLTSSSPTPHVSRPPSSAEMRPAEDDDDPPQQLYSPVEPPPAAADTVDDDEEDNGYGNGDDDDDDEEEVYETVVDDDGPDEEDEVDDEELARQDQLLAPSPTSTSRNESMHSLPASVQAQLPQSALDAQAENLPSAQPPSSSMSDVTATNSAASASAAAAATAAASSAAQSASSSAASSSTSSGSSSSSTSGPGPVPAPAAPAKESKAAAHDRSFKIALKRLQADARSMDSDPPEGCSGAPMDAANPFTWRCSVFGPEGTVWEGGVFQLQMQFGADYPQKPPHVKFTSTIYHPNVFPDGSLCLDIIQDKWSPVYSVSTILTSIQSLLDDPNPASPANPEAAKLLASDKKAYRKKVRACVEKSTQA